MESRVAQDLKKWEELYASGARPDKPPSDWVARTIAGLPNELPLVDVAGGTGRHAITAAHAGHRVVLLDFVELAVKRAQARAPSVAGVVAEVSHLPLRESAFGVVVVANFLARHSFPALVDLIAPGGFLVYETYTIHHQLLVRQGLAKGPQSEEFLLQPEELRALAGALTIVEYWEGEVNDDAGRRCCARLLARSDG